MLSNVFDIILGIFIVAYTVYCTVYAVRYLVSDIKKPFIGISSTYIFNYFLFDGMALFISCMGIPSCRENPLQIGKVMFLAMCQLVSLYNGTLFLIKKYNYTKLNTEIRITAFLQMFQFMLIAYVISMPTFKVFYQPKLAANFLEWLYILNASFSENNGFVRDFFLFVRFIPIIILSVLWVKSISKKYNKMEKSYFTKSANLPIYYFVVYECLFSILPFLKIETQFEYLIIILSVYILRLLFNTSVLKWLRHPDMEQIETNAILRSRENA